MIRGLRVSSALEASIRLVLDSTFAFALHPNYSL